MTLAVFHDFPGLENSLTKFHDFPGRVITLQYVQSVSRRCPCKPENRRSIIHKNL